MLALLTRYALDMGFVLCKEVCQLVPLFKAAPVAPPAVLALFLFKLVFVVEPMDFWRLWGTPLVRVLLESY